jgi:hypothetical protein
MLGSYRVATQLVASQVVLSSICTVSRLMGRVDRLVSRWDTRSGELHDGWGEHGVFVMKYVIMLHRVNCVMGVIILYYVDMINVVALRACLGGLCG